MFKGNWVKAAPYINETPSDYLLATFFDNLCPEERRELYKLYYGNLRDKINKVIQNEIHSEYNLSYFQRLEGKIESISSMSIGLNKKKKKKGIKKNSNTLVGIGKGALFGENYVSLIYLMFYP